MKNSDTAYGGLLCIHRLRLIGCRNFYLCSGGGSKVPRRQLGPVPPPSCFPASFTLFVLVASIRMRLLIVVDLQITNKCHKLVGLVLLDRQTEESLVPGGLQKLSGFFKLSFVILPVRFRDALLNFAESYNFYTILCFLKKREYSASDILHYVCIFKFLNDFLKIHYLIVNVSFLFSCSKYQRYP